MNHYIDLVLIRLRQGKQPYHLTTVELARQVDTRSFKVLALATGITQAQADAIGAVVQPPTLP